MILQLPFFILPVLVELQILFKYADAAFYVVGIILALVILKRRRKFRSAKFKFTIPSRWNQFKD